MAHAGYEIELDEETLVVYEDPFLAHNTLDGGAHYMAHAQSDDGTIYKVIWDIIDADCEDQSDACDWEKFRVRRA